MYGRYYEFRNPEFSIDSAGRKTSFPPGENLVFCCGSSKTLGKTRWKPYIRLPKSQGRALRICKCVEDICCPPGVYLINPWKIPGENLENTRFSPGLENCISPGESLENRFSPGIFQGKTWNPGPGEMREDRLSPGENLGKTRFSPGFPLVKSWNSGPDGPFWRNHGKPKMAQNCLLRWKDHLYTS